MGGRWYLELSATAFGIKESGAKCFWLKLAAAAVDANLTRAQVLNSQCELKHWQEFLLSTNATGPVGFLSQPTA